MNASHLIEARFYAVRFYGGAAERACRRIARMLARPGGGKRVEHLLRNHALGDIPATQEGFRDDLDELLEFCALAELGIASGVLRAEPPAEFRAAVLPILSHPSVRGFYERDYPQLLSTFFRMRLEGRPFLERIVSPQRAGCFVRLLRLADSLGEDDVDLFLAVLDDYECERENGTTDIRKVWQVLRHSHRMLGSLTRTPSRRTATDDAIQGLLKFLDVLQELDRLLASMAHEPALRSAYWYHFSYWLDLFGVATSSVLRQAVQRFREWVPAERGSRKKEAQATFAAMAATDEQIGRLTSGFYRAEIDRQLFGAKECLLGLLRGRVESLRSSFLERAQKLHAALSMVPGYEAVDIDEGATLGMLKDLSMPVYLPMKVDALTLKKGGKMAGKLPSGMTVNWTVSGKKLSKIKVYVSQGSLPFGSKHLH